jgi:hypothetical protein
MSMLRKPAVAATAAFALCALAGPPALAARAATLPQSTQWAPSVGRQMICGGGGNCARSV